MDIFTDIEERILYVNDLIFQKKQKQKKEKDEFKKSFLGSEISMLDSELSFLRSLILKYK